MFDNPTPFKHYGCGGIIYRQKLPVDPTFRCATCLKHSGDILDLITDPRLHPRPIGKTKHAKISPHSAVPAPKAD